MSYQIRNARTDDLDVIAGFEVQIALVSFGAEAITDPQLHRRRVAGALGKPGEFTLVAIAASGSGINAGGSDVEAGGSDVEAGGSGIAAGGSGIEAGGSGIEAGGSGIEAGGPDVALGWAWLTARTNSLTGARYGNFRSLAVAEVPDRGLIGELLMTAILAAAEREQFTMLTGKVHAGNLGMRTLYRAFGFTATHITMEKRIEP